MRRLLHTISFCRAGVVLALVGTLICTQNLAAQSTVPVDWQRVDHGRSTSLKSYNAFPLDSLASVAAQVLAEDHENGYYFAALDSAVVGDTLYPPVPATLFINRGTRVTVTSITWTGIEALTASVIEDLMGTRVGKVLSESTLEDDVARVLQAYEIEGYPFATVHIDSVTVQRVDNKNGLHVALRVDEGNRVRINDIVLSGGKRTNIAYIEQITGLRRGDWLSQDLDIVQQALSSSQLFAQVGAPQLIKIGTEDVVVQLPVVEEAPGSFDLVLGYQPPAAGSQTQGLVGNGHLNLRNMFGGGRAIALRLNRLPGQVSSVTASFADPYLFGLPFSVSGSFDGLQQDSTYGQQAYRGAVGYRVAGGLETFLTISREVTRPGQAGLALQNNTQRIPRSEVVFAGLSFRYLKVDRPLNPQRGFYVETQFERGRKVRNQLERSTAGDTTSVRTVTRQERLTFDARLFVPTFRKQVFVLGNETRVLVSKDFDTSDLFRLGGARSLRGYDEDRFRGRFVSRTLVEYRYLFERQSFAYLFFDLGYVDQPATPELTRMRELYPGYGLGMQFETGIGLINTSLALSTSDNPSQAKVHVGLSLGL
ncbi:MAG: BamA/TamA family outer membrane protein [Bacteroidota bacterium]